MSSIAIKFDGLALLATLALSVAGFLVIAAAATIRARLRPAHADAEWRCALRAGAMALATLALATGLSLWWAGTSASGLRPWLDQLIWPWLAMFLTGCRILASGSSR